MKAQFTDYFSQLGIKTPEKLTDSEIDEIYFEKLLELYIKIRREKERLEEKEKLAMEQGEEETKEDNISLAKKAEEKSDMYKEEIYAKLRILPSTRAKSVVLENWIHELGITKKDKVNFDMNVEQLKTAYTAIRDEDARKEYWRKTVKNKALEYQLEELIKKYGGDTREVLETQYINVGNLPTNIMQNPNIIPYEFKYEDSDIRLSIKNDILFENDMTKDQVTDYLLVLKGEDNMDFVCTAQGTIVIPELRNPKYKAVLMQAILQNRREGMTYFGDVDKVGGRYVMKKDRAQEIVLEKVKEMELQQIKENAKHTQGEDGR